MKAICWLIVLAVVLSLDAVVWAQTPSGDEPVVRPARPSGSHLDQTAIQLLYVKTASYGSTWTDVRQAGDITGLVPGMLISPDFSAVVMNNNELCYAVTLLSAPVPGVYALAGPLFQPVLVMPQGSNHFDHGLNSMGWTDIGRTPNGDLFILIWGSNAAMQNTFWVTKSTDNGASWGTPFVIAAEPVLPAGAQYPHIADINHPSFGFVLYQVPGSTYWNQYALRFPTAGGPGTMVQLPLGSFSEFSYYTANCKPIAFDPVANSLYVCYRSFDLSATTVCSSLDLGLTFTTTSIPGAQRYPSIAVRTGNATPFVFSNVGIPPAGNYHYAWFAYMLGGVWTAPQTLATAPAPFDGIGPLFYQNEGYFWDALHGVAMNNLWGAYTPEGIFTERSTTGGTSWTAAEQRWYYQQAPGFEPGSSQNAELVGGVNGVAYVVFSGNPDEILPVELAAFTATAAGDGIHLDFATASEHNNDHFEILRSISQDGPFSSLTTLPSHGNSSTEQRYAFVDRNVTLGQQYWYYLADVSLNGERTEHRELLRSATAFSAPALPADYALNAYPNPFNPGATVSFSLPEAGDVRLDVYDLSGRHVRALAHGTMSAGEHRARFDASSLTTGVYIVRMTCGELTMSRKLMLLK